MPERLPLSALLSQTLVAFVIEFDNEFERRTLHRTTNYGATGDAKHLPWLTSMALWFRLLRFVPPDGEVPLTELRRATGYSAAQFRQWLTRSSKWWGYVKVRPDGMVQPTAGGAKAIHVWNDLNEAMEARWNHRFGDDVQRLRVVLKAIVDKNDRVLLGDSVPALEIASDDRSILLLPVLLGNVLLLLRQDYEETAHISLAVSANLLRVLTQEGTPARDLPKLTGTAKEALSMLAKAAEKQGYVASGSENRVRTLKLTAAGIEVKQRYCETSDQIEQQWQQHFDKDTMAELRAHLEALAPRLHLALEGYPEGWRASLPVRQVLPHCPMISHRGGFPDGS